MNIAIFKIKDGKLDQWKNWVEYLRAQKEEVIKSLQEENLISEKCFVFNINTDWYTLFTSEGEGKPANMDRVLNQEHKKNMKECFESKIIPENMYFFNIEG